MRSSKTRSRSKSNRNRSVGNIVNRVFDSSGPEGKVRGTPQQIIEKYNQLARDASLANDRVALENFQQHAEHYTRLLGEAQREQDARREQQEREQQDRNKDRNDGRGDGRNDGRNDTRNDGRNDGRNDNRNDGRNDNDHRDRSQQPQPQQPPENQPQPDTQPAPDAQKSDEVIDMHTGDGDAGLVETPESKPQRTRRPRKPKAQPAPAQDNDASGKDAPEAAE